MRLLVPREMESMTSPDKDIKGLPDYAALQQLARALWRNGSVRGASVLVGAGLSKNAERPGDDTPEPPLWWELLKDMVERLYPNDKSAAPSNPLRVVEEYRTYFGQAGLDDFIRTRLPDRSWSPGPLHMELLELPWMDVLTTNWDTLLELASENVSEYSYEIVRTEADLTHARSPRIVKLHGTIGDAGPLIFAEEDYRTYPAKYAAFVNLARQIFIENELCLIGFSGDDPNFLQWAGWVRDHLGGSARRIYLVGNLRLEDATRKYLEAQNVAPIDLAPLVKDLPRKSQHAEATRIFFEALRQAKPAPVHEWTQTPPDQFPLTRAGADAYQRVHKDAPFAADLLEKTIPLFKVDRESYPGWLVCPFKRRRYLLHSGGENWLLRKPVLDLLKPKARADAVFEILWRRTVAFHPLEPQLVTAMAEIVEAKFPEVDLGLRLEFAAALLRDARVSQNDDDLKRWADLIEAETPADSPVRQEAQYQLCLRARDRLDGIGLRASLARITAETPIWKLRRAALHAEIGEYAKATALIKNAAAELERRHRRDRNSLSIKSQLAWANWISRASDASNFAARAASPRPRDFKELDIDPLGEIEYIEDRARDIDEKRREEEVEIEPAFDAGHYREGSRRIHTGGDPGINLLYEFDQLTEFVGLPLRINHVDICADSALAAIKVARQPTFEWYVWLLRALHSHFDGPFKRYFGRVPIAQMRAEVSSTLLSCIDSAITFWTGRLKEAQGVEFREDHRRAVDVLRLLVMVLSRLTVRMSEEQASRGFARALELAKDPLVFYGWVEEALGELIKYAAAVVPVAKQGGFALSVMEFPMAAEKGTQDRVWPRPVMAIWESTPDRDLTDLRWDSRIRQLVAAAEKGEPGRQDAILRLCYLAIRDALNTEERASFGRALWSDLDGKENALPANTGLLTSTLARLPAGEGIDAPARVRARLFGPDLRQVMSVPALLDTRLIQEKVEHLASLQNARHYALELPPNIAVRMFDEIVAWNEQKARDSHPFADSFISDFNNEVRRHAGEVLSFVVAPVMPVEERTEQRATALLEFIARSQSWTSVGALPRFVGSAPALGVDIVSAIRTGLVGSEFQQAGSAAVAVEIWAKLVREGALKELPRLLIDQLIATIETRQEGGLQAMLRTASTLVKENFLEPSDCERLMKALEKIRAEFRYVDKDAVGGVRAVTISLIRAEAVKLAVALKGRITDEGTLQAWIDEAKSDPLPEVRFSLTSS
jgi:hypothetical protein